ncbi:maleylpyruvate isomerase family mycothiol-dependent enzyme [Streptomyces sp. SID13666]|uniref:maleylpyruvate isomerase family mycothiol-dependent enzyme n=1 Tax=unclassified Streptomyces TaxID=2593676 RepID=UPI0013BF6ECF|nr:MULTISPECIES: maleylpyruvate isomerase family mycothiol-dependent enzyme [unclassified Streptomyces]NEA55091.1 maleylpyruvate isomerase family mycothiol-dependent enzyme [Streptomyces sp. SID13666]NEA71098.1 maleylpyruvate isomerase family mycothiol-dependent enzyme [Streptomyces sp. SID13588]
MGKIAHGCPESEVRAAIAEERRELAAVFDKLPEQKWDESTLCSGWRVREVVAHMSLGFRYSIPRVAKELVKARGSLNRMTDRCARQDAASFSTGQLTGFLRDNATHPWKPPVGGIVAALGHDVVHGLDITVPTGVDRQVPEDRLRILLDAVDPKSFKFFGARLDGVQLRAIDLDWTFGTGSPVTGTAQDLLLLTFGRKLPKGRIEGPQADRFDLV